MSRTIIITTAPIAQFSGPPADRMAGREQARSARMARGSYAPGAAGAKAAAAARARAAKSSAAAREHLLDRAVASGVINDGVRGHYAAAFDADPDGCRRYLATIGLREEEASLPDDGMTLLNDVERERVVAARAGQRPRFVNGV